MRISTVLFFAALTTVSLRSQTTPEHKEIIVVTGEWEPLVLDETDRSVNAYPVRNRVASFNSLADVIGEDSSVYVRSRGANGTQVDFSIRGASFEQTLMLLNGIRINDEQSAHYNSDFAIPLDAVDHVEVLRGAGSTLYGSDASGGVINFVTEPVADSKPLELTVRGDGGSFGTNEQSGFLSFLKGPLSERISFERDLSSGFTDDRE
ncbi:MAG: TonB-dependent receptor, partial [Bryobacterales bacterium]|nr:TonB-dependent receptor [Bryobacterales bacterium]